MWDASVETRRRKVITTRIFIFAGHESEGPGNIFRGEPAKNDTVELFGLISGAQ
jgi:hypothetical protein